jgi:hypothetical protein
MNSTPPRGRRTLIALMLVFAAPVLVSFVLVQSGWRPKGTRSFGTLLSAPQDLNAVAVRNAAGETLAWATANADWTVLVATPDGCGEPCLRTVDALHRIWVGLGRNAKRARIFQTGGADEALQKALANAPEIVPVTLTPFPLPTTPAPVPAVDERIAVLPVYVVDPHGFIVLRYDTGTDLTGLRKDLARVLK